MRERGDARDLTYVNNTILTIPLYANYHIATQAEAYEFYNLAIDPNTSVIDTAADETFTTRIAGDRDRFGGSLFRGYGAYGNYRPPKTLSKTVLMAKLMIVSAELSILTS